MATIYVATDGVDGRSGLSRLDAVRTVERAFELVRHNQPQWQDRMDIVFAAGTTYDLKRAGSADGFVFEVPSGIGPHAQPLLLQGQPTDELGELNVTSYVAAPLPPSQPTGPPPPIFVTSVTDLELAENPSMAVDRHVGKTLLITAGPAVGQRRMIESNSLDTFVLNAPLEIPSGATMENNSTFQVSKPAVEIGFSDQVVQFVGGRIAMKDIKWQYTGSIKLGEKEAASFVFQNCFCRCEGVEFNLNTNAVNNAPSTDPNNLGADDYKPAALAIVYGAVLDSSARGFFQGRDIDNPFNDDRRPAGIHIRGGQSVGIFGRGQLGQVIGLKGGYFLMQDGNLDFNDTAVGGFTHLVLRKARISASGMSKIVLSGTPEKSALIEGFHVGDAGVGMPPSFAAVRILSHSLGILKWVQIKDVSGVQSRANAIAVSDHSYLTCIAVSGGVAGPIEPNVGVGILCDLGSQVRVNGAMPAQGIPATSISGAGGDIMVGQTIVPWSDIAKNQNTATIPAAGGTGGVRYLANAGRIRIVHTRAPDAGLSVGVRDGAIIVRLAWNPNTRLVTSTVGSVIAAIQANPLASALVSAVATGSSTAPAQTSAANIGGVQYAALADDFIVVVQAALNQAQALMPPILTPQPPLAPWPFTIYLPSPMRTVTSTDIRVMADGRSSPLAFIPGTFPDPSGNFPNATQGDCYYTTRPRNTNETPGPRLIVFWKDYTKGTRIRVIYNSALRVTAAGNMVLINLATNMNGTVLSQSSDVIARINTPNMPVFASLLGNDAPATPGQAALYSVLNPRGGYADREGGNYVHLL